MTRIATPTGADCGANCGTKEAHGAAFPICAFYRDESGLMQKRLDALSQDTPRYSLQAGGAVHRLWIINDPVVLRASCADFTGRLLAVAGGRSSGRRTQRPALPCRAGPV